MDAQQVTEEQQDLYINSEMAVIVVGRAESFVLFERDKCDDDAKMKEAHAIPEAHVCGVLGLKDGEPLARCSADPDSIYTMMFAGVAFARIVADRIIQERNGDFVDWARRLHGLPDSRPN